MYICLFSLAATHCWSRSTFFCYNWHSINFIIDDLDDLEVYGTSAEKSLGGKLTCYAFEVPLFIFHYSRSASVSSFSVGLFLLKSEKSFLCCFWFHTEGTKEVFPFDSL